MRFTGKCNYCNKVGHKEKDCFKKKKDEEAKLNNNDNANFATMENSDAVFIARDDITSWSSGSYYKIMSDDISSEEDDDDDCEYGFSSKIRIALRLDEDVAMISYSDDDDDKI